MSKRNFNAFDKCTAYTILTSIVAGTIGTMARFRRVPKDKIITDTYNRLKDCASK